MKVFKLLIVFAVIIFFCSSSNAQQFLVKTNVFNPIFLYPNLDVEYQLNNKHAIAIHTSVGNSFFIKRNSELYYKFVTGTIDYFYSIYNSDNRKDQIRTMVYGGLIQRKIYQDDVFVNVISLHNRKGRDFTGNAVRGGIGLSVLNEITSRFKIENNFGIGYGRYIYTNDVYYKDYERAYNGYLDLRYALNICYKLF